MAEELQSLLEKIQSEGVAKAEARAAEIVAAAEKKAASIVADAEKKAAEARAAAEADAKAAEARANESLKQAGRDVVLTVAKNVQETLERVLLADVRAALRTDFLQSFAEMLAKGTDGAELHVEPAKAEELAAYLRSRLADEVAKGLKVAPDKDVTAGIGVRLEDGRVEHDFSDKAIAEALAAVVRPSLAAVVFGK